MAYQEKTPLAMAEKAISDDLQKLNNVLQERLSRMDERILSLENQMRQILQNQTRGNNKVKQDPSDHETKTLGLGNMTLEVPQFDGNNAQHWVWKIQQFFKLFRTPENQRIDIATFRMEGPAFTWSMFVKNHGLVGNWKEFLDALLRRFGPSEFENPIIGLKALQQTSTVEEYQTQFEALCARIKEGLSESWYVSFFIAGLQEHLRLELLIKQPDTYCEAVSLAKLHEWKHNRMVELSMEP